MILGIPWLKRHDPHIHWSRHQITFGSEYCLSECQVQTPCTISAQSRTKLPHPEPSPSPPTSTLDFVLRALNTESRNTSFRSSTSAFVLAMPIRLNPCSRSSPILVRSARHECEAVQLRDLHTANLKTPRTTPSHQIQILTHVFAYVRANVHIYVLAYVLTYAFVYVLAYVLIYVLAYVPFSALSPQVPTGCHLDGSGHHANGPGPTGRSAAATGCSAVAIGYYPEDPGCSTEDPKSIPYSESLPGQLRGVEPMRTTPGLPDLPANHDPSRYRL